MTRRRSRRAAQPAADPIPGSSAGAGTSTSATEVEATVPSGAAAAAATADGKRRRADADAGPEDGASAKRQAMGAEEDDPICLD